ncbi:TetR/AcrR family transcriptional regulator [Rhodococcoides yunnanense]|uniref:TetR/AcrR family transcriptional regulator n=1 Tax=Rhodococcoides yunnanense TaxID=278209 RepID=UPI0009343AE9|nr:TetR family transcriptional regulator [Rhodococcus yunnanensis]
MVSSDGRRVRGDRARTAILERAADIASAEGLEGLSLGRLATECAVSKSNVAALFGGKQQLQLAAVAYASEVFQEHVVVPTLDGDSGLPRLHALYRNWIDYSRRRIFSGGCFFAAVGAEFDARPGQVRDALQQGRRTWLALQENLVTEAQTQGALDDNLDPGQLVFELDACMVAANSHSLLFDDDSAYDRAWSAITSRIGTSHTDRQHDERT